MGTIVGVSAFFASAGLTGPMGRTAPKNVLLIILDDLRPQLKSYGHSFMATENMDRLAAEGVSAHPAASTPSCVLNCHFDHLRFCLKGRMYSSRSAARQSIALRPRLPCPAPPISNALAGPLTFGSPR